MTPPGARRPRSRIASLAFAGLAVVAAACSATSTSPSSGAPELTVFAAASLTAVMRDVRDRYERSHPGLRLVVSTDSSAALATKIEQAAPADLFLSADTANPKRLVDAGLATAPVTSFASNRLIVIVPTGNPAGIRSPADLARAGVRIVAAGDAVPVTKYASQLVTRLGALPGYPPGFAASYASNVISRENDVAAVVAKIALGEGDAAIVYTTDARSSAGKVTPIDVPAEANVAAVYGGVVVAASHHAADARSLLAWLVGGDGAGILRSFGFLPPP